MDRETQTRVNAGRRHKAGKTTAKDRPSLSPCCGKRPHWSKLSFDVGKEICAYGFRAVLYGQDVEPFQDWCRVNGYTDLAQGIFFFHFSNDVNQRREIKREWWDSNKGDMKRDFMVCITWIADNQPQNLTHV